MHFLRLRPSLRMRQMQVFGRQPDVGHSMDRQKRMDHVPDRTHLVFGSCRWRRMQCRHQSDAWQGWYHLQRKGGFRHAAGLWRLFEGMHGPQGQHPIRRSVFRRRWSAADMEGRSIGYIKDKRPPYRPSVTLQESVTAKLP